MLRPYWYGMKNRLESLYRVRNRFTAMTPKEEEEKLRKLHWIFHICPEYTHYVMYVCRMTFSINVRHGLAPSNINYTNNRGPFQFFKVLCRAIIKLISDCISYKHGHINVGTCGSSCARHKNINCYDRYRQLLKMHFNC